MNLDQLLTENPLNTLPRGPAKWSQGPIPPQARPQTPRTQRKGIDATQEYTPTPQTPTTPKPRGAGIPHTCPTCDKTYNVSKTKATQYAEEPQTCPRCGEQLHIIGPNQSSLIGLLNNVTGKQKGEDIYHRTGTQGILKLLSYDHLWNNLHNTPPGKTVWNHLPQPTRLNWLKLLNKKKLI